MPFHDNTAIVQHARNAAASCARPATPREHEHAFQHLGGVARVCLYDNFTVVVPRHDADGPLDNPKFLAFATHYGFRPQACRVRRPQTKGKVERQFHFVETSLFNGRTFESLEHLNEVSARVPYICKVAPSGKYHMEDVFRAGGISAILKTL